MRQIVLKYGIICALISIFLTVILYVTGLDMSSNYLVLTGIGIIILIVVIILSVKAVKDFRSEKNGVIKFSQAFLTAFFTFVIYVILSNSYGYVQNNYINKDYADKMKIMTLDRVQERFENSDVPKEQQEMILQKLTERDFSYSPQKFLFALGMFTFLFTIISLIIAAAIKKDINQMTISQT